MYNARLKRWIVNAFRKLFLYKAFYPLHKVAFKLSLHGMGMLNYENRRLSGEEVLLKKVLGDSNGRRYVVIDVGANDGSYSTMVKGIAPDSAVYAFEPHPLAFLRLEEHARSNGFMAFNVGCSDMGGKCILYDYKGGTAHASLNRDVITEIHKKEPIEYLIQVIRLDDFVQKQTSIHRIRLLKTDTEGNDLNVLRGAQSLITQNAIDIVQFEFNEMNVLTRVFFKDFIDLLSDFRFYRLLPNGAVPLGEYYPISFELFAFQNIAAVRNDLDLAIE
jgi:FkbM family methyltransferase